MTEEVIGFIVNIKERISNMHYYAGNPLFHAMKL